MKNSNGLISKLLIGGALGANLAVAGYVATVAVESKSQLAVLQLKVTMMDLNLQRVLEDLPKLHAKDAALERRVDRLDNRPSKP